jgi:hypothetical protein
VHPAVDAGGVLPITQPGPTGGAGEPQYRHLMGRFHRLQLEGRDMVPGSQRCAATGDPGDCNPAAVIDIQPKAETFTAQLDPMSDHGLVNVGSLRLTGTTLPLELMLPQHRDHLVSERAGHRSASDCRDSLSRGWNNHPGGRR